MKKCEYIGHQGDVCFFKIDEFPSIETNEDDQTKYGILAFGEATGHAHQIIDEDMPKVRRFKLIHGGKEMIGLEVKEEITIEHGRQRGWVGKEADHDYHNPIILKPGKYLTGIVEEYDPFEKVVRRVID